MTPELSILLLTSCPPIPGVIYGSSIHRLTGPWIYIRLDEEASPWFVAKLTDDPAKAATVEQVLAALRGATPVEH